MGRVKGLGHAARPSLARSVADMAQATLSTGSRSHLVHVGSRPQTLYPTHTAVTCTR